LSLGVLGLVEWACMVCVLLVFTLQGGIVVVWFVGTLYRKIKWNYEMVKIGMNSKGNKIKPSGCYRKESGPEDPTPNLEDDRGGMMRVIVENDGLNWRSTGRDLVLFLSLKIRLEKI
jgi:hypothetical protein